MSAKNNPIPEFFAVVLSHNVLTGETLHQPFEGQDAADQAAGWMHEDSFIRRDFPESQGWIHTCWMSAAARSNRTERLMKEWNTIGGHYETVPK